MKDNQIDEIRRFVRFLNREFKLFSESTWQKFEINHTQSQLLFFINAHCPITSKELTEEFYMEKSSMSRSLKILESKNLIAFSQKKSDLRSKDIRMTSQGKKLLNILNQYGQSHFKSLFSKEEQATLKKMYEAINLLSFN